MGRFESIKDLLAHSNKSFNYSDNNLKVDLPLEELVYNKALVCAEQNLIDPVYSFWFKNKSHDKNFVLWSLLPEPLKNGAVKHFTISINLQSLRLDGLHIYYDENELINTCPLSPERFLIINLGINNGECTICPEEYSKNEISRYRQVRKIWELLSDCADHQNGTELIFLYKQKLSINLIYELSDLESDFDGLAKLEMIFTDQLHVEAKKNIMRSTLHSFLWREKGANALKKLLSDFTLFSLMFQENFSAYSVGFSFDKIRKEYSEKFRDYLSRLNGIMYDTLTRSLSIPISSLVSFVAMKGGLSGNEVIINIGALLLIIFASFNIHYLVKFQLTMIKISCAEYKELFKGIRTELNQLELIELSEKENDLNKQSDKVKSILHFVYSISICNLILNGVLFVTTTF
ncbi:hypothetical protein ACR71X_13000 [Klebsiella oxytoca]|nr:hypothetical protein [Klebsiella oxytoca]